MAYAKKHLIRVVIIDASSSARGMLVSLLGNADGIQVVGSGETGEDASRLIKRLNPDVMILDVTLKAANGFNITRQVMREMPLPIILVTSNLMPDEANLTFQALNAGALAVLAKPVNGDSEACKQLIQTIKVMAGVPVVHHWGRQSAADRCAASAAQPMLKKGAAPQLKQLKMIGVAASTGGPGALATVFRSLPAEFPWPILVVQHITNGFGTGLVQWVGTQTALRTRMAEHGEVPRAGDILFAPDDHNMQVNRKGEVELIKSAPYKGLRPSGNPLFQSIAAVYRSGAVGIILTGMGDDGADGIEELYQAGGFTIAQSEESCVIYGMPRAAVEKRAISQVLSVEEIGQTLSSYAAIHTKGAVSE